MASRRLERIASVIKQTASQAILYKLKDPRRGFITVTRVEVTADLRHAKLFVSVLGEESKQRTSLRGLNSARGFIQTEVAKALSTRFAPEIAFEFDPAPARSIEIRQLIDRALAEDESRHPHADPDETDDAPESVDADEDTWDGDQFDEDT